MQTITPREPAHDTYLSRNRLWLLPLVATIVLVAAAPITSIFGFHALLPGWLTALFGVLGAVLTGFRVVRTDTASAYVLARLGVAFGLCVVAYSIYRAVAA